MRHNKKFNHLGRKSAHRKAMLANMASSLIENKRITTTLAKAKALRTYVEPLITKAKNDTTHSRRVVFSYLQNKDAVSVLFREVAEKIADRPGGYTRILKTGNRLGDNAEMCIIELVDYNEAMLASKEEAAKPKRRRSRRGGAKKTETTATAVKETAVAEKEAPEVVEDVQPIEEPEAPEVVEDVQPIEEPEAAAETEVKSEETSEEPKAEDTAEEADESDEEAKKEE
jgi:large subunit ribosomal protein L17